MTKRRLDNDDLVNILRQKNKQDPVLQQKTAKNTFARLMKAQQSQPPKKANGPSYEYFNAEQNGALHSTESTTTCHRCNNPSVYDKCTFCESNMCQSCLQQCSACEYVYCGGCSVLDYSLSVDQVFCISCIQH